MFQRFGDHDLTVTSKDVSQLVDYRHVPVGGQFLIKVLGSFQCIPAIAALCPVLDARVS